MPVIPAPVLISVSHDNCGQNKTNNITDTKLVSETNRTISVECVGVHVSCKVLMNTKRDVGRKKQNNSCFCVSASLPQECRLFAGAACKYGGAACTTTGECCAFHSCIADKCERGGMLRVHPLALFGFCPLVKKLTSTSQLQAMIHYTHTPEEAHPIPFPFC
jgi:hypothetical protein